jgi:hypothetical protein
VAILVAIFLFADFRKIKRELGLENNATDSGAPQNGNGGNLPLPEIPSLLYTDSMAKTDAMALYEAMKGWGTDENAIWAVLDGKTDDQLNMIQNQFQVILGEKRESGNLISWFQDDLSGQDLQKALAYFD